MEKDKWIDQVIHDSGLLSDLQIQALSLLICSDIVKQIKVYADQTFVTECIIGLKKEMLENQNPVASHYGKKLIKEIWKKVDNVARFEKVPSTTHPALLPMGCGIDTVMYYPREGKYTMVDRLILKFCLFDRDSLVSLIRSCGYWSTVDQIAEINKNAAKLPTYDKIFKWILSILGNRFILPGAITAKEFDLLFDEFIGDESCHS